MLVEDPAVEQGVVPIAGGHVSTTRAENDHQDDEGHPLVPPDTGRDEEEQLALDQEAHALVHPSARAI